MSNPGCESNTGGWSGYQGSLTRVTHAAHSGVASCQAIYSSGGYYTIDDNPASVARPPQGAKYTASAWVRSDTAVGKPVRLILRQRGGAAPTKWSESATIALSRSWQRLEVSTVIDSPGRETLEVYVAQTDAVGGNSFQLDDVSLTQVSDGAAPAPSPAPTQAPPTPTPAPPAPAPPPAPTQAPPSAPAPQPAPSADTLNAQTWAASVFSASSPWNLPAQGGVDPQSGAMIGNLRSALAVHGFDVQTSQWTVPVYYADNGTPRVRVEPSTNWWGGFTAPMPPQAQPDPAGDHHLAIWDVVNQKLYEFYGASKSGGTWRAQYGIVFDAQGGGYQTGIWQNSARASGVSLLGGLIRYHEMKNGNIPHALALAYPTTRGDKYARAAGQSGVWGIASHNDNSRDPSRMTSANIPEGARLRLKASVDVNARCGGNRACQVIGQALKTYGAFVVDTAGAPVFYAENLQGKSVSWNGLLSPTDARAFQADDFEVLALPPLTSAP